MQATTGAVTADKFDSRQLRQALGRYATGVAIVTARGAEQECIGLTVNSFSSVSLDPPLVLWSLANKSINLHHFKGASHFAVHVLGEDQMDLAKRFASNVPQRFDGLPVVDGIGATPLIEGCPVRLHCETESVMEAGDHHIFMGRVVDMQECGSAADSLLFYRGKFLASSRSAELNASE